MRTIRVTEGERLSLHRLLEHLLQEQAKTGAVVPHKRYPVDERATYLNKGDLANLATLRDKVE